MTDEPEEQPPYVTDGFTLTAEEYVYVADLLRIPGWWKDDDLPLFNVSHPRLFQDLYDVEINQIAVSYQKPENRYFLYAPISGQTRWLRAKTRLECIGRLLKELFV